MKFDSCSNAFADFQSVSRPSKIHTASMTTCTISGGLAKFLISVISSFDKLSNAFSAFSNAGIASSKSACASSAITLVSAACLLTTSTTFSTLAFKISAAF